MNEGDFWWGLPLPLVKRSKKDSPKGLIDLGLES